MLNGRRGNCRSRFTQDRDASRCRNCSATRSCCLPVPGFESRQDDGAVRARPAQRGHRRGRGRGDRVAGMTAGTALSGLFFDALRVKIRGNSGRRWPAALLVYTAAPARTRPRRLDAFCSRDPERESSRLQTRGALRALRTSRVSAGPPCFSLRTSRAFHAELPAPFTPYLTRFSLPYFPRPSLRTSRALHSLPPAPFPPYLPCSSLT